VIEKLSHDLKKEYPGEAGFSSHNLWDMKRFYEQYASHKKLRQAVAEIPWGHNLLIMSKISDFKARSYYKNEWHNRYYDICQLSKETNEYEQKNNYHHRQFRHPRC